MLQVCHVVTRHRRLWPLLRAARSTRPEPSRVESTGSLIHFLVVPWCKSASKRLRAPRQHQWVLCRGNGTHRIRAPRQHQWVLLLRPPLLLRRPRLATMTWPTMGRWLPRSRRRRNSPHYARMSVSPMSALLAQFTRHVHVPSFRLCNLSL